MYTGFRYIPTIASFAFVIWIFPHLVLNRISPVIVTHPIPCPLSNLEKER